LISSYHDLFDSILTYSLKSSFRKNSVLTDTDFIISNISNDIIKPLYKYSIISSDLSSIYSILTNANESEIDFLEESINCAILGYYRASIILAWSAAVDRIHRTIEKCGFDKFNTASNEIKLKTEGRYKRFNKSYNISSLSDLRMTVFDNDLLWVIEYMDLIDGNQHDRLSICFTMRNNSAHPGEAIISKENLLSFYSDIDNYIFLNNNFLI